MSLGVSASVGLEKGKLSTGVPSVNFGISGDVLLNLLPVRGRVLLLDPKSSTLNRLGFPSGRFSDSSYWLGLEASMDEALFE